MSKGFFIAIEGIEGTGKSTLASGLESCLSQTYDVVLTREPGGPEVAEKIREILKNQAYEIDATSELLLMFAARSLHIKQTIRPLLDKDKIVISDRYVDASYAYQGGGRGIALDKVKQLDSWVCQDLVPDVVILLTHRPEDAMSRVAKRQSYLDRFEQEKVEFFYRAQAAYIEQVKTRKCYHIIQAEQSEEVVLQSAIEFLKTLL
ncbi:dTMP kinase [Gammaproteobacteria bacterium]|nr:dTMP kinase [Gammaproteobacteria bacterium]